MNWRYLLGACLLAAYLLVRAGVPLVPVAAGLAFACGLTWARRNRSASGPPLPARARARSADK